MTFSPLCYDHLRSEPEIGDFNTPLIMKAIQTSFTKFPFVRISKIKLTRKIKINLQTNIVGKNGVDPVRVFFLVLVENFITCKQSQIVGGIAGEADYIQRTIIKIQPGHRSPPHVENNLRVERNCPCQKIHPADNLKIILG